MKRDLLAVLVAAPAWAQQVKPYILLEFDTSLSMTWDVCGINDVDDSFDCPGIDNPCATCLTQGCGNGLLDDSRLWKVKKAGREVINSFGEATYALARYHQMPATWECRLPDGDPTPSGSWFCPASANCGGAAEGTGLNSADIVVPFSNDNQQDLLDWMDLCDNWPTRNDCSPTSNLAPSAGCNLCPTCGGSCDKELRGTRGTPFGGSLISLRQYLENDVMPNDPALGCRPYAVIVLTDGDEPDTCGGNPIARAAELCSIGVPTYIIGFANQNQGNLNAIADAGCGPGCDWRGCRDTAIFTDNETDLALAFAEIIQGSVLSEQCNGMDDDCDGLVDEDFPGLGQACCDPCNGLVVCNAAGDGSLCNGLGPCSETCNARDDDCDGLVDEGIVPPCQYEACNGIDDDLDGLTDELPLPGLGQFCGTDEGECNIGVTCCDAGAFACCGADSPAQERCDCLDNNCNGLTDEAGSRRCYDGPAVECPDPASGDCNGICQPGVQPCVTLGCPSTPGFGPCLGQIGSRPEACNCLDDNCNGLVDDGATCPNGTPCTDCGCPNACDPLSEFPCPAGFVCSGNCPDSPEPSVCLADPCLGVVCGLNEYCDTCTGACVDLCAPVDCGEWECCAGACCETWQTCQDANGDGTATCDDTSCSNPAFPCAEGEICKEHTCVGDTCSDVHCGDTEFCLDGKCLPVCPTCREDERCVEGRCVADPCSGDPCVGANVICCEGQCQNDPCAASIPCDPGEYCDGCAGTCRDDTCARIRCPGTYQCVRGQCELVDRLHPVTDLSASGAGGCACALNRAPPRAPIDLALLLLLAAFGVLRRRR